MDTRREGLHEIAESTSSAPRLANSSAASFTRRNECPGTNCSPIEQKEKTVPAREIEVKVKMEERTERQG